MNDQEILGIATKFERDQSYEEGVVGQACHVSFSSKKQIGDWGHLTCQVSNIHNESPILPMSSGFALMGSDHKSIPANTFLRYKGELKQPVYIQVAFVYANGKDAILIHEDELGIGRVDYSIDLNKLLHRHIIREK